MKIRTFNVLPTLPAGMKPLGELAQNLWFSWNWDAVQLFLRLNPDLWFKSYQNPVWMLGSMPLADLQKAEQNPEFQEQLKRIHKKFKDDLSQPTWFDRAHGGEKGASIAYFSCEYGIEECLPIYSGGLGLLSGDHLKSASDLGIPLVAVGLLYQQGYFRQSLSRDGWQEEHYPDNDWYNMPVRTEQDKNGRPAPETRAEPALGAPEALTRPVKVSVDLAGENVVIQVWKVHVGRTPLYLLDTNIPENSPNQRAITSRLYGGDRDMRMRQEIVLGIGGIRALAALGYKPTVHHMNEGHSAFLAIERIRDLMSTRHLAFDEARQIVWASNVFTTHTPVPAGNEQFEFDLLRHYFGKFHESLGLSWGDFAALGQEVPGQSPKFNMTVMAIRMAAHCNGVAKLHGVVSRKMWHDLWPGLPEPEIPITSITNGVHTRSWVSHELWDLLERHMGKNFLGDPWDQKSWDKVGGIPDEEIWEVRMARSEKLLKFVRRRIKEQLIRRGADATEVAGADRLLNPRALTIGFARRFATYKRGDLIFSDPDRLHKILSDPQRPVQIIFAGKAHPQDTQGKELIKTLANFARNDERFVGRVVFVEDYDINVARYLVQGVDVWLNNPRRPMEASGTSGMKAAVNGTLNLSFLDGWWDEAYTPDAGWAIGESGKYENEAEQDRIEAQALYNLLERDLVPKFYDRPDGGSAAADRDVRGAADRPADVGDIGTWGAGGADPDGGDKKGLPKKWIAMMKASIQNLGSVFNTHRMVAEYTDRFYVPAHRFGRKLESDGAAAARNLASWRKRIASAWPGVKLECDDMQMDRLVKAGDRIPVTVRAALGPLSPNDVSVEIYHGDLDGSGGCIIYGEAVAMSEDGKQGELHVFKAEISCQRSGRHAVAARILPKHPDLVHPFTPFHLTWES